MLVNILRKNLLSGSFLASKIITGKSNLPILSNLYIHADEQNFIQIQSSNLELSIRLQIPAKVEKPGKITVPARKFTDYLASLSGEKLVLKVEKNQLLVEGDQNKASFVTMPASEFPELPTESKTAPEIYVSVMNFRNMVKKIVFATASGDTHPVLTGVLFDFKQASAKDGTKEVIIVATDSFRLSQTRLEIDNEDLIQDLKQKRIIVPVAALMEVDHLISEEVSKGIDAKEEKLKIKLSENENQIFVHLGEVEIMSRLLEADFPDYKKIIPSDFKCVAVFDRISLIDAVKTTAIFASREGRTIRSNFLVNESQVKFNAQNSEVGSYTGEIYGELSGEDLQVGFNSKYLLEGLSSFDTSQIKMHLSGVESPTLIEPIESTVDYIHIIMPMSLNSGV